MKLNHQIFSFIFFFLFSLLNKYLGSVNLNTVDIGISEFGENFDPSKLDLNGSNRENIRRSVLSVLKKVADLSIQNLKRNADGCLATVPHNNDSLLWPGGKHTQNDLFSLSS